MVAGSPLVSCFVSLLLVALALVADLAEGVVGISVIPLKLPLRATEGIARGTVATGTTQSNDTKGNTKSASTDTAWTATEAAGSTEALTSMGTSKDLNLGSRIAGWQNHKPQARFCR